MLKTLNTYFLNHPKVAKRVQYILIGLFVFLIAFDIFLAATKKPTISNIIKHGTENGFFVLTYFWGVLAANLFITQKKKKLVHEVTGTIIVISIALAIIVFNIGKLIIDFCEDHSALILAHLISMAFGTIIGVLFWRQEHN